MSKYTRYTHTILTLLMIGLVCQIASPLWNMILQPAAAARGTEARSGARTDPVASPQSPIPGRGVPAVSAPRGAEAQASSQPTILEEASVLEFRDGKLTCRAGSEEERRNSPRRHHTDLHVISDRAAASISTEQPQTGLKIVMRGTQQLEQHPEAKEAFLRAAHIWESLIQDRITVVIDVDYGPTNFGKPFGEGIYGLTYSQGYVPEGGYSLVRNNLFYSASTPREAALYRLLPPQQLPTDLGATSAVVMPSALARALWLRPRVADPEAEQRYGRPPSIGFNSAIPVDFDPSDGIKAKRLDFTANALHEIGHALGFFSMVGERELDPGRLLAPSLMDWFRFRPGITAETFATAPRIQSSGGEQVFFNGLSELPLSTGRIDRTGGDGQQACHWKDYYFPDQPIGIMDPTSDAGIHYEITENDLQALSLMGYHTNPLLGARQTELKIDDATTESFVYYNGLIVVNRLTPPSYPATLHKLRLVIPYYQNQPDVTGKPITLLIYASENSNGQVPVNPPFVRISTIVPSADTQNFLEFDLPYTPTINSGDFYVGFQVPSPYDGVVCGIDTSGGGENRTFYSIDGGESLRPMTEVFQGPAQAMIRAVISTGVPPPPPSPTPVPTPGPREAALTSGVPYQGSMIGWSPGGALYITQYTIQVPSGATQLKIDLEGNTELDLYVRFGTRVMLVDGSFVGDFKAETEGNSESITITPNSSPPLQAGTYYIGVINYGPGPSHYTVTATVANASNVVNLSAASFAGQWLAGDSIVVAYGNQLATKIKPHPFDWLPTMIAGTTVKVRDSAGIEQLSRLFFVSPTQVNYLLPPDLALGQAVVTITSGDGTVSTGAINIANVAPGLFTANSDGKGPASAVVLRVGPGGVRRFEPTAIYDAGRQSCVNVPIDLGGVGDQLYLLLFGTGFRHRSALSAVTIDLGGVSAEALYAGPQGNSDGLDQLNLLLPRSLKGRGEVTLNLTVDGKQANPVTLP